MPDLGNYAFAVLAAWGATLVLMGFLLALTLVQARRARYALALAEERIAARVQPKAAEGA
ncbi:heme exporter protein CcmD [Pseudogemmobacter bohemicus]|uniref:heme exporter protein CcmD n=1 Tax=Pseudogemmobacter bohemicus TaxID=2250708 RepID=UPI000DD4E5A4|nr:heme exporter protein CcmD [Pseudogemmobacter bohemicus]